ncbi:MAG: response regulator [Sediminispirochaetaceae bacterium]
MAEAEENYVLIVEDEDGVRLTLRDFFFTRGIPVLVASDGVGAIKQILDHRVKVIVSDYRMEVFGGEYWMKFLEKFCGDKTVIITSGFLRPEFSIPFETIYKPFDYGELAEKVEKALRQ